MYLEKLENAGSKILYLRPRRFGKTLFTSIQGFKEEDLYSDYDNGICKTEYEDGEGNCVSPYYASNVETMRRAFGTLATDENVCNYGSSNSSCYLSGLGVSIGSDGEVGVYDESWVCNVDENGYSSCDE